VSLSEQIELADAAWLHERRVPKGMPGGGRWVRGGPGLFRVAGYGPRERKPEVGDKVVGEPGLVVGTVVARVGMVAAVDADDGKRYQFDWGSGKVLNREPLSRAMPASVLRAAGRQAEPPPHLMDIHGTQLWLPGMPARPIVSEYGAGSAPVRRLEDMFTSGVLSQAVDKPDDQPEQGMMGVTEIMTLPDGSKVLRKRQEAIYNDSEELAYYVSQALGGGSGLPAVARNPNDPEEIIEDVVPGKVAWRYAEEETQPGGNWDGYTPAEVFDDMPQTQAGFDIGMLDLLTGNYDRHDANLMIDDRGEPAAIDMGAAQWDGFSDSPFISLDEGEMDPELTADYARELHKIEPEFRRLGHEDWYVVMMDTLRRYGEGGQPLSNQLEAIELASGLAWLHERRIPKGMPHAGEWVHTPPDAPGKGLDRYKVPAHERLINPRADYPDPADMPFFKKHPVSVQNVLDAYDATDSDLRDAGMHWYHDAHLLAAAMSGGNAEEGAILLANYSPSANWPVNMFRAARVGHDRKPIPKGQGYISGDQVKKAQLALNGKHIDEVLVSPKTRSFAHLIARGKDADDDPYGHVVIDAHALNIAAGGALRGATYARGKKRGVKLPPEDVPPVGSDVRAHEYVGDMYRQAAKIVSEREGRLITPYQMQAITWVGQVLANQAEDRAAMEQVGGAKGRLANRAKDWRTWLSYARAQHLPMIPGVSALANEMALAQIIEMAGAGSLFAQLIELDWEQQPRDREGRWTRIGGLAEQLVGREAEYQRTRAAREDRRTHGRHEYPMIGPEHARGNSRPVSRAEFQELARKGNQWIDKAKRDATPINALDQHWDEIKSRGWAEVSKSWGGATIDSHTAEFLPDGADKYALTVRPRHMVPVHLPETISRADFERAMDQAKEMFRPVLERQSFYLGLFHDDDLHQIDIDPVAVVDSPDLVEQVGAYTHAIGGAYHFATGNGYWPPHVAEGADMAAGDVHFEHGLAQWHSQAVQVQGEEGTEPEEPGGDDDDEPAELAHFNPLQPRGHGGEWIKMGGGGWEGRDRALAEWFHPQQLEADEVRHPKSGYMVKAGLERTVTRPPESQHGNESLGIEGPPTFDVKDHGDPASPDYNSLRYMLPPVLRTEPIQHVYRGISEDEWRQAQERGYLQSDTRGVISPLEGTNAAVDPASAVSYLPSEGHSRIVKIKVRPEDKWFTIRSDNYLRTRQPIPLDRVEGVSPPMRKEGKYDELQVQQSPVLQARDYEGEVGNETHITRSEEGLIPLSAIAHLPGARGERPSEHRNRQGDKWQSFKDDIGRNGIRNPIFITVDYNGQPVISEGNHRRDAAAEVGQTHVPVQIRYFGHAEQQGTVLQRAQAEMSEPTYDGAVAMATRLAEVAAGAVDGESISGTIALADGLASRLS